MAPFSDPKCSSLGSREFAAPSPDLLQRPRLRNSRRASGNLRNSNVGVHPPAAPSAGIGNASVTIIPASIAWFLIDLTGAPQRGSIDERELPSVAPENAVRIALEFVDRHVGRFGFHGVGRRRDVRLGSPAGFLIERAD
jgi:hypothetical protein